MAAKPAHNPGTVGEPVVPSAPDLYTAHSGTIEAALAHACRGHRLRADAADEFCGWARLRLIDNDQAVLRKFQGRSSLRTFLITVVNRLYLDWRNVEWGKWRPTADARRLGPVAVELERLVIRDQLSFGEASQTLMSQGSATGEECQLAWERLPRRPRRRRVGEEQLAALPSGVLASDDIEADESQTEARAVADALEHAVRALPAGDQVMLQLRYWSGLTVARIAVLTGEDQKALYRRFERMAVQLRRSMEARGVTGPAVAAVLGHLPNAPPETPPVGSGGTRVLRPSRVMSTGEEHA